MLDGTIEFLLPFEAGLQSVAGLPQKIAALKEPAFASGLFYLRGRHVRCPVTKGHSTLQSPGCGRFRATAAQQKGVANAVPVLSTNIIELNVSKFAGLRATNQMHSPVVVRGSFKDALRLFEAGRMKRAYLL